MPRDFLWLSIGLLCPKRSLKSHWAIWQTKESPKNGPILAHKFDWEIALFAKIEILDFV